jgi:hypothetical protein
MQVEDTRDARRPTGKSIHNREADGSPNIASTQDSETSGNINSMQDVNEVLSCKTAAGPVVRIASIQPTQNMQEVTDELLQSTIEARPKASTKPIRRATVPRSDSASDSAFATAATDRPCSSGVSGLASKIDRPVKKVDLKATVNSLKQTASTSSIEVQMLKDSGTLYDSASRRFLR